MSDKLSDEQIRELADDMDSGRTTSGKRLFSDRNLLAFARAILAASPAPAISESDVLRHRALAAEARCDHVIKILTRIHGFLLPNDVRLPDGRVFEFNNPKVEHEMLRGLRDAIRAVPDEIAAIDAARKGEKS
ncbi:hypothetical protein [Burkholderia gladioli]|uniref:hypothetical protein n=1 Tax=Burkholderia gladioli TaxID=28095 RepID=UPI00164030AB|nr:hypothetical protein [Burkholderia gladioli]